MPNPTPTKTDSQDQEAASSQPKTLWVVSNLGNDRVALWEPDPLHPGGELFVAGKVPAEAALTAEVSGKLRLGQLREATDAEVAKRKAQLGAATGEAPKGLWD